MSTADRVDIVVSFVLESGLDRVFEHLRDLLNRGGQLRILTGDYLGISEPDALMRLLDLEGDVVRRVYETGTEPDQAGLPGHRSFHPKAYILKRGSDVSCQSVTGQVISVGNCRHRRPGWICPWTLRNEALNFV